MSSPLFNNPEFREDMQTLLKNIMRFREAQGMPPMSFYNKRDGQDNNRNAFIKATIFTINYKVTKAGKVFEDIFKEDPSDPHWEDKIVKEVYTSLRKDWDFVNKTELKNQKSEEECVKFREVANAFMKSRDFLSAVKSYTKSISLAPHSIVSDVLALAFANRGAALKSLGHFKQSIVDCERALECGYPVNMKWKLYIRVAQCYQQLRETDQAQDWFNKATQALDNSKLSPEETLKVRQNIADDVELCVKSAGNVVLEEKFKPISLKDAGVPQVSPAPPPRLTKGTNKECESLSAKVLLKYTKSLGRHLVAAEDIKPGDVLMVEEANCALLEDKFKLSHCAHCFQRCRNLLPCRDCSWSMYCSDECLTAAMKYHKLECAVVPFVREHFNHLELLTVRLIARTGVDKLCEIAEEFTLTRPHTEQQHRTIGFDKNGKLPAGLQGLLSHQFYDEFSVADICRCSILAVCLVKMCKLGYLKNKIPKFGGIILKMVHSVAAVVKINLREHELKGSQYKYNEIGTFASTCIGFLKHSCNPNVTLHQHKTTTVMRAVQVIAKDQFIEMAYSDQRFARYPKAARDESLKLAVPNCQCEACVNDWPIEDLLPPCPIFNLPQEVDKYENLFTNMEIMMKNSKGEKGMFIVTKETLPQLLRVIMMLDKYNKKLNEVYVTRVEEVTEYFAKQGNLFNTCNMPYIFHLISALLCSYIGINAEYIMY